MIAESRHNLANWIMWLILLVALPPALVRCRQQLFSNRVILEGKGAEFLDSEESRMLTVRLAGPAFSDRDVVRLRGLPVDRVMLRDSAISDQALKELAEHHEIVTLDLSGTNVTSAGIRTLATFPKLIQLRIEDCRGIAAADLEPLTRSRSLRILMLGAVNYSRDELHRLDTTFPIPVSIDPAAYLDTPAWLRPVWLQGKHAAVKLNFFGSPDRPRQTAVLAMQLAALRHPEIVEQLHVYFIGVPEPNAPSRIEGV